MPKYKSRLEATTHVTDPTESQGITSRPYKPLRCCENCVFGSGPHAEWCEKRETDLIDRYVRPAVEDWADRLLARDLQEVEAWAAGELEEK